MRQPRIFHPQTIQLNQTFTLSDDASNHVGRVLRMKPEQPLILFCGDGYDYAAKIVAVSKKHVEVLAEQRQQVDNESPLKIHLAQGVSRGDKMDFTIQKSVELGITEITPIFTNRCGVKLSGDRLQKKHQQWQKIAISACEQSGRAVVPKVNEPISFEEFVKQETNETKLNLHPRAAISVKGLAKPENGVRFIIGPEGGLTDEEIQLASEQGFQDVLLGPRVLRTETAALTLLTALQVQFGDLV